MVLASVMVLVTVPGNTCRISRMLGKSFPLTTSRCSGGFFTTRYGSSEAYDAAAGLHRSSYSQSSNVSFRNWNSFTHSPRSISATQSFSIPEPTPASSDGMMMMPAPVVRLVRLFHNGRILHNGTFLAFQILRSRNGCTRASKLSEEQRVPGNASFTTNSSRYFGPCVATIHNWTLTAFGNEP